MEPSNERALTISVVTAGYNCVATLPGLIESLRRQTDPDFEWVVADGGSTDGTLELLRSVTDLRIRISSQRDFGIYDALNRGLSMAKGDYYLVAGADDAFSDDAIARFRSAIEGTPRDILAAPVSYDRYLFRIRRGPSWLVGEKAFIANHSIGTAFRRSLHDRFGLYSRKLPIAADSLFVLQACRGGATRSELDFVAGTIGMRGTSEADWAGSATELFRAQLMVGEPLLRQLPLLLLRLLKGASASAKAVHDKLFR